jgi:hypothetical protein
MLIIGEQGTDLCNDENVFTFSIGTLKDGTDCLIAYGLGANIVLASVGDRPNRALEHIVKAHRENWKVCDLNDLLGTRPNLAIAKSIVDSNGEKLIG